METSAGRKVLGIVGSPRRHGNTEILVDEILKGAEEVGACTEKVILNELDISPCRACNACHKIGECVQEDDMKELLEKMEKSQVWVLGTPVYWWGPTAQFKTFLDRWYGAGEVTFKGRRVVITIPLGGGATYARYTKGILTEVVGYLGMDLVATVIAPGAHSLGAVRGHDEVLAEARRAGREAVEGR
jgi:multimeric flavodoxin WrbA